MPLRVGHEHSQFVPILTCFVHYYAPFWGPESISIVVDPQGALTCRSSTLAVFLDSDPFRGLLLTVLWSQSDFHGCQTQGILTCWSSGLAVWADSGLFHGPTLTVLGSQSDFHD